MKGETTKYYKYDKSGSGSLTVPIALANALEWEHKDQIHIIIKTIGNNTGLFFYKQKE